MNNATLELISDETSIERKVEIITERTTQRLLNLIGQKEVPSELQYIVDEVTIKRFNRLGNEGMQSSTQEGLAMVFDSSDFAEFKDEIDNWIELNQPSKIKKQVFFYA